MFENFNARRINLNEAKRILDRNGNVYSDEEVKMIVDYLHALAELEVAHVKNWNRKDRTIPGICEDVDD